MRILLKMEMNLVNKWFSRYQNCGLTDFAEDPFKDYRYEDPFSIQDPFADETSTGNLHFCHKKKNKRKDFGFL